MSAVADPFSASTIADTPTGLSAEQIQGLADHEALLLGAWHISKAGDDLGRAWWPHAVRSMPLRIRLALASDVALDQAWEVRERYRATKQVDHFVLNYGHVQPEEGPPIPFDLWPEQLPVLDAFDRQRRVIVLKARQLGLTWLALHYAAWVLALAPHTPNARVLALSKHGGDATKLLARVRRIFELLPPFLRPTEASDTRRSLTRLQLEGRGSIVSLAGTPESARMETATLALLDEFAFVRHGAAAGTWTSVLGTLGKRSKAFVISTGNGDAETPGDGQAFAKLWEQANSGRSTTQRPNDGPGLLLTPIFLPSSVHPDRDDAWRLAKRAEFLSEEEFLAEYPETEEEALAGHSGTRVWPLAGINAAERLGAQFDQMRAEGTMAPPLSDVLLGGADWGECTHLLIVWPLEGGGIYVVAEHCPPLGFAEPAASARAFCALAARVQVRTDEAPVPWPPVHEVRYDAAGVQSQRTFNAVAESEAHADDGNGWHDVPYLEQFVSRRGKMRAQPIPFNRLKTMGKDYLKHLFTRAAEGRTVRVVAISPTCTQLLRQARRLEVVDDGTGTIKKGDDHGPDALIAVAAPMAEVWYGRQNGEAQRAMSLAPGYRALNGIKVLVGSMPGLLAMRLDDRAVVALTIDEVQALNDDGRLEGWQPPAPDG